jgi:gliding motility-associated-like protein
MKMQKFLTAILLSLQLSAFSTHIVGGDITVKFISGNDFEVTMRFYRDCAGSAFDNPAILGAYDKVTNIEAFQFSLPLISNQVLTLGDSCFTPNLCVEEGVFRSIVTFPDNVNGYYLSWQRCCRNGIIQNIVLPGDAGMVFYAELPDPLIENSTPTFGSYPSAYMCNGQPNTQDFSAVDIDGDSLAYSLSTPLNGNSSASVPTPAPSAGPYSLITWQSPYSATDMIGGSPPMSIHPVTGILTANPATLGVFVFAVVVEEFRAGVKIGEIRRDIQYQVIVCNTNQPPVFSEPAASPTNYTVVAGDSLCIPIAASDINGDWIGLSASSELFTDVSTAFHTDFTPDSAAASVSSMLCFRSDCVHIREQPYTVTFYSRDYSCYGTNVVPAVVSITVVSPLDGQMDKLIPNVFTPNNDQQNDFFKVAAENINDCFDSFNIAIYNRWGQPVFDSPDFHFKWDGKNKKGKELSPGVYFYLIEGNFQSQSFRYNGMVQLLR